LNIFIYDFNKILIISSDRPKAYTFTKLFRDTLTIFDHFCVSGGRQNPCVVIGHSYGGSIATALARSRPDHIKVLVRKLS
jgi:pimeloyl-ACP methyl ester carboxylesterase